MIERILLDVDGLLADFVEGAVRWHKAFYPNYPHDPESQTEQTAYDIAGIFGMEQASFWEPLGFKFWSGLKPTPFMGEVLELLEGRFGQKNICLATSPCDTFGCLEGKKAWILKHVPQYRRRRHFGSAKEFFAAPWSALIDDYTKNCNAFVKAGGTAFLFPSPWNARFKEDPVSALKIWLDELD